MRILFFRLHIMLFPLWLINFLSFQPDHYVAHLIGHEGHGSLLSVLKNKGNPISRFEIIVMRVIKEGSGSRITEKAC